MRPTDSTTRRRTLTAHLCKLSGSCCLLALLPLAGLRANAAEASAAAPPPAAQAASAPAPAPPTTGEIPSVVPKISYDGGQLTIRAVASSLRDVLSKVAALTGVTIELPEGADSVLPMLQLGPGPAREVLASLLNDSRVDYLIQASNADPNKLESVLIMPRTKGSTGSDPEAAGRPSRSPFVRPAPEAAEPEIAPVTTSTITLSPPASPTPSADAASFQPDSSAELALSSQQTLPASGLRPGALTPPAELTPQSINQQLQQMYQQRVQLNQQGQSATAAVKP